MQKSNHFFTDAKGLRKMELFLRVFLIGVGGVGRSKKGLGEGIFLREVTLRRPGRPSPRGCRRAKKGRETGPAA